MKTRRNRPCTHWLLALTFLVLAAPARAEDVHVMVSGAFTAPYRVLVAEWEKTTGNRVVTVYGASMGATPTAIPNRLARGEQADVVILARSALDALVRDGKVVDGSEVDLVRSRIGMAVKAGAKAPDISTEARFRQVLLDATSIAYSDSASGVYIATEMFRTLGIAEQVAHKSMKIEGTPVGDAVAKGDAEIGFQQISELRPVRGITVVGPIPDPEQRVTIFSAGIAKTARAQGAGRQLVAYLASMQAWKTVRASGLEPATADVQTTTAAWTVRTPWGDPDYQGDWTSEGEYGVPLERPAQFGTRAFLNDEEYAKRLAEVRERDEKDLAAVNVQSGKVDAPNAPIPHWREYETSSRRTSLVIDPADGRLPRRMPGASPWPVREKCGSLQRGEPCDSYTDYGLGVRCIVHGAGFPDAMFPAVYNANFRIVQAPGYVAINYELIHDTRVIPIVPASERDGPLSAPVRSYMGTARGWWEGTTLVVESTGFKALTRGASPGLRLIERFTRTGRGSIDYQVTFIDPATWAAPWTAALSLTARTDDVGVFEYACHEGNYGLRNMLSTSRYLERTNK